MLPGSKQELFKQLLEKNRWNIVERDYMSSLYNWKSYCACVFHPWLIENWTWIKDYTYMHGDCYYFSMTGILDNESLLDDDVQDYFQQAEKLETVTDNVSKNQKLFHSQKGSK